jgi:hypothetical protein
MVYIKWWIALAGANVCIDGCIKLFYGWNPKHTYCCDFNQPPNINMVIWCIQPGWVIRIWWILNGG